MDSDVDHYDVLGLPSGEEGAKLSEKEISKAYRLKALELHPDKRPDDRNAHANFQRLKTSYEVLKDEKARKLFDDLLRVKRDKIRRQSQHDSKRRKMMSDLEERERASFEPDPCKKAQDEEERIARKLKEEIAKIRAMHANKASATTPSPMKKETAAGGEKESTGGGSRSSLDKEKVLKVTWEKIGVDYTAQQLTELFGQFGEVEDVVIKSSRKKGSALVVMTSKDAVASACGNVLGDLSNPLLVVPLVPSNPPYASPPFYSASKGPFSSASNGPFSSASKDVEEPNRPAFTNLVGAGYKSFEDAVLEKMRKAAQRQK